MASNAVISRFESLTRTTAALLVTTWDSWLTDLAGEPREVFGGTHDHWGWSAAEFEPPLRAKENVVRVHGLVLDYDKDASWDKARALWSPTNGLLYTTKSHSAEADRLRVVMPFARPVTPDEYDVLWSWAAARSAGGGAVVDRQCRDASRFWYGPTTPPGGWRSERFTGLPLNPDAILAQHAAAIASAAAVRVVNEPAVYVAHESKLRRASAYLARMAPAVQGSNGSTALFKAVQAMLFGFDLSESDVESLILAEYNPRCEPPWSEREVQHKVTSCAKDCGSERGYLLKDSRGERPTLLGIVPHAVEPRAESPELPWHDGALRKPDLSYIKAYCNVAIFVRRWPEYAGRWSYNEMTSQPCLDGEPVPPQFIAQCRAEAERVMRISPTREDIVDAMQAAALEKPFHPVRRYLRSLTWDGVPRLSAVAREHMGVETELAAVQVRKWMISAVARAMVPGCKVDTALMLVGAQGAVKSTFFRALGSPWFSDSLLDISGKDGYMLLHEAWIYELAELEVSIGSKDVSRVKAFLSSSVDSFRAPYARAVSKHPRAMVFCGSTNTSDFLADSTGSRRFWVIRTERSVVEADIAAARDQLWAEAVAAYDAGEQWWLTAEQDVVREVVNAEFAAEDPWTDSVSRYLTPMVTQTTTSDILTQCIKKDEQHQNKGDQMRIGAIMRRLGWVRYQVGTGAARRWVYRPQ